MDYRAHKEAITVVLPASTIDNFRDHYAFKKYVEKCLKERGAVGHGDVHAWEYSDGSIRYTFQPKR